MRLTWSKLVCAAVLLSLQSFRVDGLIVDKTNNFAYG